MEEKKRTKAEYRSSLRSKRLIREALITMMREKPFEKITITDIVKTADINRGTFYAHYKDIGEVLSSIKELAIAELSAAFDGMTPDIILANPRPLFDSLTALLMKDREYYRLIFAVEEFRESVMESRFRIADYLMKSTSVQHLATDSSQRAKLAGSLDFLLSGIIDLYTDVLCEKVPLDLESLPEIMTKLSGSVVKQLTEQSVR